MESSSPLTSTTSYLLENTWVGVFYSDGLLAGALPQNARDSVIPSGLVSLDIFVSPYGLVNGIGRNLEGETKSIWERTVEKTANRLPEFQFEQLQSPEPTMGCLATEAFLFSCPFPFSTPLLLSPSDRTVYHLCFLSPTFFCLLCLQVATISKTHPMKWLQIWNLSSLKWLRFYKTKHLRESNICWRSTLSHSWYWNTICLWTLHTYIW